MNQTFTNCDTSILLSLWCTESYILDLLLRYFISVKSPISFCSVPMTNVIKLEELLRLLQGLGCRLGWRMVDWLPLWQVRWVRIQTTCYWGQPLLGVQSENIFYFNQSEPCLGYNIIPHILAGLETSAICSAWDKHHLAMNFPINQNHLPDVEWMFDWGDLPCHQGA